MNFNIGDKVNVKDGSGNYLRLGVIITNISPCGEYIQTSAGISYMPVKQIEHERKSN